MFEIQAAGRLSQTLVHTVTYRASLFCWPKTGMSSNSYQIQALQDYMWAYFWQFSNWFQFILLEMMVIEAGKWRLCATTMFFSMPIGRTSLCTFFACPSISNDNATVFAQVFSHPGNFSVAPTEVRDSNVKISRWVHPKYSWSRNDVGSPRSKSFINIFHMRAIPSCRKWLQAIFANEFKNNFVNNTELQKNGTATYLFRKMWSASKKKRLQSFSLIKMFIFSCPEGNKLPLYTRLSRTTLHVSIATSLHENKPLSSTVHQLSGLLTCLLLLGTLKITVGLGVSLCVPWCLECVLVCAVCGVLCVVCGVWCGTLKTSVCRFKTPPCAGKTPVSHETRAFWRHIRRRFESTHGGVLNLQTHTHEHRLRSNTYAHPNISESPPLAHKPPTMGHESYLIFPTPMSSQQAHARHACSHHRRTDRERRTDTDRPTDRQRDKWSGVSVIVRESVSS